MTFYTVRISVSDAVISPEPVVVTAKPGVSSYSVSFGDGGESQLLESNWIHHTVHVAATNRVGQGLIMKVGTMPLFYGLRPWQTTLVVPILGLVVSMLWIWKVKKGTYHP